TLRIGRATDTLPVTVPHVIARRHRQGGQPKYEDAWLLRDGLNQKAESSEQRQNGLKMVDQAIWSKKMSNGVRRTPVSAEQALYVNPSDCYNSHWPIVRGQLNVHSGSGGSLTAVLADLETIWSYVIQKHLEIPLKELKALFGIWRFRCDPHFLLAPAEGRVSLQRLSADQQAGLSAPSASKGDLMSFGSGGGMLGEMELGPAQGECLMGSGEVEEPLSTHLSRKTAIISQFESKALGLDKAILHSIDCCASDETKRKMYSSILVVGGGLMFHGAQEFLLHRIINKMPPSFRRLVDNVEVVTRPKPSQRCLQRYASGSALFCSSPHYAAITSGEGGAYLGNIFTAQPESFGWLVVHYNRCEWKVKHVNKSEFPGAKSTQHDAALMIYHPISGTLRLLLASK
ncbi:hypothetical protein GOODEAATRI_011311, partial [Goodea atripinnis]